MHVNMAGERPGPELSDAVVPPQAPKNELETSSPESSDGRTSRRNLGRFILAVGGAAVAIGVLTSACEREEDVIPQTPTSPAATAEISPTADFDFTIPTEDLESWTKALEFLMNREQQLGGRFFIDNEEITISVGKGAESELVSPALIVTIKRLGEYDSIKEKYAAILAERFDPLNICNIEGIDEYGTVVRRGIIWPVTDLNPPQDIIDKRRITPDCF